MASTVGKTLSARIPTLLRFCQSTTASSGVVAQNSARFTTAGTVTVRRGFLNVQERSSQLITAVVASSSHKRDFSVASPANKKDELSVTYINRDGVSTTVKTEVGQNLLDVAIDNDLDIEGFGACEGTLACSTCHLIFEQKYYDLLPKPSDEELDMLDLAYGLLETSRLGCQCILTKEMDGLTASVPEGVHDAREA